MKPTTFAHHLTSFLTDYLPAQRNVSANTIKAYRDVFVLFLRYCRDARKLIPERLQLQQIDAPFIMEFLEFLEKERQCRTRTRNHRLAALHSFFRYLQTESPEYILQWQRILAIPFHRFEPRVIRYLAPDDLKAILSMPDLATRSGRRDALLLSLLYDSGARVQELINIRLRDIRLDSPPYVRLTGKGRKTRMVPLMASTVALLSEYLTGNGRCVPNDTDNPLFTNRFREKLSRSGIRYILLKHTKRASLTRPGLKDPISPHTLRHTKAMHLLETGNPLVVIRDFLGHVDINTTEIYARSNLEMKREALEKAEKLSPTITPPKPTWKNDKKLLEWLKTL